MFLKMLTSIGIDAAIPNVPAKNVLIHPEIDSFVMISIVAYTIADMIAVVKLVCKITIVEIIKYSYFLEMIPYTPKKINAVANCCGSELFSPPIKGIHVKTSIVIAI